MAGRYYQASPIGAGMANLADAIGGIPAAREKAGLMAAQRQLYEDKLLTEASQRAHYDAQTQDIRDKRQALVDAGDAARLAYLGPQAPAAPDVTGAIVPGVGAVPGAAPVPPVPPPGQAIEPTGPDLASTIGGPSISNPNPGGFAPPQLQQAVAAVQSLPPQTQRELFANLVGKMTSAGSSMANVFPDLQLAIAGGQQGTSDKPVYTAPQMSGFQEGAKVSTQNTETGFEKKQAQDLKIENMKEGAAMQRALLHENRADARAERKGSGKGGTPKPMTAAELNRVRTLLSTSGGTTQPTAPQLQSMMNQFQKYRDEGMSTVDAINQVADESWQEVETPAEPGYFGTKIGAKPATTATKFAGRVRPTITQEQLDEQRATGEKPTAAAAPAAAPLPIPDKGKRKVGETYTNAHGQKAKWTGSGWQPVN